MLDSRQPPEMTEAEFRMLAEMVRKHSGLHFGPETRFLLEKRVARRMRDLELTRFSAYHYLLRSGGRADGELPQLIDELTTNETYFFRESGQLHGLVNELIPVRGCSGRSFRSTSGRRGAPAARSPTAS